MFSYLLDLNQIIHIKKIFENKQQNQTKPHNTETTNVHTLLNFQLVVRKNIKKGTFKIDWKLASSHQLKSNIQHSQNLAILLSPHSFQVFRFISHALSWYNTGMGCTRMKYIIIHSLNFLVGSASYAGSPNGFTFTTKVF